MTPILSLCLITVAAMGGQIQLYENSNGGTSREPVFNQQNAWHNGQKNQEKVGASFAGAIGTLHGTLKKVSDKIIEIETHEKHIISIQRTRGTKFFKSYEPIKASDIDLETPVAIDVRAARAGFLGVNVSIDSPPSETEAFAK